MIDALQKELATTAAKSGQPASTRILFDEPSGRLIVRATPDVHRQLSNRLSRAAN
jgi:hypothetical protein